MTTTVSTSFRAIQPMSILAGTRPNDDYTHSLSGMESHKAEPTSRLLCDVSQGEPALSFETGTSRAHSWLVPGNSSVDWPGRTGCSGWVPRHDGRANSSQGPHSERTAHPRAQAWRRTKHPLPIPLVKAVPAAFTALALPMYSCRVVPLPSGSGGASAVQMFFTKSNLTRKDAAAYDVGTRSLVGTPVLAIDTQYRPNTLIVRPRVGNAFSQHRKGKGIPTMPRPVRASLSLVEGIDGYGELLTEYARDGVIEPHELHSLQRRLRPLQRMAARLDDSLRFVDLAIHGNGIDSPWFDRKWKEDRQDRDRLRLVVRNEDGPEPPTSGPARKVAA